MAPPLVVAGVGFVVGKFASDVISSEDDYQIGTKGTGKQWFPKETAFGDATGRGMGIPVAINFKADMYENKQQYREDVIAGELTDITLPLPVQLSDDTSINYTRGQSETTGGIWDMTSGGWRESWRTWFGISTWFSDVLGFSSLSGQRPMDESDNIFKSAEMRKHSYSWILIPKNGDEGKRVDEIVKTFQRMAYPMASGDEIYSRVIHPPIWQISTMDMVDGLDTTWVIDPLPSVLTTVKIKTADGALHQTQGGYPAATALTIEFAELEPAINTGSFLQSRSQLRGGAARGGD